MSDYTPEVQARLEETGRSGATPYASDIAAALHELQRRGERIAELETEWRSCCEREQARWHAEKELRAENAELEAQQSSDRAWIDLDAQTKDLQQQEIDALEAENAKLKRVAEAAKVAYETCPIEWRPFEEALAALEEP